MNYPRGSFKGLDKKELRALAEASTEVVAWYAHEYGDDRAYGHATVRGPFGRWFACFGGDNGMGDAAKYPVPVADHENDVKFAAAAMNNLVPLLDENEALQREIKYLRQYGNKDCTAMADQAMEKGELEVD